MDMAHYNVLACRLFLGKMSEKPRPWNWTQLLLLGCQMCEGSSQCGSFTRSCATVRKNSWFFPSYCSVEPVLQSKSSSWCLLENLPASDNVIFHVCSQEIDVSHLCLSPCFHRMMEYPDPQGSAKSISWPLLLMTSLEIIFFFFVNIQWEITECRRGIFFLFQFLSDLSFSACSSPKQI